MEVRERKGKGGERKRIIMEKGMTKEREGKEMIRTRKERE